MSLGLLRAMVWPFAALGLAAAVWAAVVPTVLPSASMSRAESPRSAEDSVLKDAADLGAVARVVTERDLFRRSRRPGPLNAMVPAAGASPAAHRPALTLVGLVSGREPSAVVEGFPGVQGPRVVRPGDVIGELTVRRITRTTVEISGLDTLWVLLVREPWKQP